MPRSQIDVLLNLVPDNPSAVVTYLSQNPSLASHKDAHGYTLLHAASSYSHPDLIRTLVRDYNVNPNTVDEDNETPLFAVENEEVARLLLELGADVWWKNEDGLTAEEKIDADGEFPLVATFLRSHVSEMPARGSEHAASEHHATTETGLTVAATETNGTTTHPPPLPNNVKVSIGTMAEPEGEPPDPEFRRRIEELAARDDFQTEEGQRELRILVQDAVAGLRESAVTSEGRGVRRRVED
jgi:uncharacterized protein